RDGPYSRLHPFPTRRSSDLIATAEAVSLAGATPRFVDVDPVSGLLTAEILERALTPSVRCVIPVHLYGTTVDMDPLLEVARAARDRKSTRLNSSHQIISYAV